MATLHTGAHTAAGGHERRGGWRQRQERERTRSPPREVPSFLVQEALLDYAMGEHSGSKCQKLAAAGVADGIANAALTRLASAGSWGANPQNVQRDIMHRFARKDLLPMVKSLPNSVCNAIVYPHELWSYLYEHWPGEWRRRFGAEEGACADFWTQLAGTTLGAELFQVHEHLRARENLQLTIPIASLVLIRHGPARRGVAGAWGDPGQGPSVRGPLAPAGARELPGPGGHRGHFDGGPITKARSAWVLSWGGLLAAGGELHIRFLAAAYEEDPAQLENHLWREYKWSLQCMHKGRWPRVDSSGAPFEAGTWRHAKRGQYLCPHGLAGWTACHILVKGDLAAYAKLGLNNFNSHHPCVPPVPASVRQFSVCKQVGVGAGRGGGGRTLGGDTRVPNRLFALPIASASCGTA